MPKPPSLDQRLARLSAKSIEARRAAIVELGQMGAAAAPAIPRLLALLEDHATLDTWPSSYGPTGHDPAVDFVLAVAAADALVAIGPPAIEPVLEILRGSTSDPRRYHAALVAGRLGIAAAARYLAAMITSFESISLRVNFDQHLDYPVCEAAFVALARINAKRARAALAALVRARPGTRAWVFARLAADPGARYTLARLRADGIVAPDRAAPPRTRSRR